MNRRPLREYVAFIVAVVLGCAAGVTWFTVVPKGRGSEEALAWGVLAIAALAALGVAAILGVRGRALLFFAGLTAVSPFTALLALYALLIFAGLVFEIIACLLHQLFGVTSARWCEP